MLSHCLLVCAKKFESASWRASLFIPRSCSLACLQNGLELATSFCFFCRKRLLSFRRLSGSRAVDVVLEAEIKVLPLPCSRLVPIKGMYASYCMYRNAFLVVALEHRRTMTAKPYLGLPAMKSLPSFRRPLAN